MADTQRRQSDGFKKSKEVLEELRQLKIKLIGLDKEKAIYKVGSEFAVFATEETKLSRKRQDEKLELKQKVKRIRLKVNQFKRTLNDMKTDPSSVEKIKETLEEIERAILSFKDKQKEIYEELLKQERLVWQEVTAYKRQIEAWTTAANDEGHVTSHVTNARDDQTVSNTTPLAVVAFQNFLYQTGGHTGGWEELDQQIFIKLWSKHKGTDSLLDEATREIPSHSPDEIRQHMEWYSKYCSLRDSKRKVIADWKEKREVEKKKVMVERTDNAEKNNDRLLSVKEQLLEKERQEKKIKLEQWKVKKQEVTFAEEEEAKMKREIEEAKERKKRERRQALLKIQVQEYTKRREEEKEERYSSEKAEMDSQRERARAANKQIHQFQLRDTASLQAKQELLAIQWQEQELKKARLEKLKETVAITATRDPTRLLKPTSVWTERQKADLSLSPLTSTPSLKSIPKRATPTWRQNL